MSSQLCYPNFTLEEDQSPNLIQVLAQGTSHFTQRGSAHITGVPEVTLCERGDDGQMQLAHMGQRLEVLRCPSVLGQLVRVWEQGRDPCAPSPCRGRRSRRLDSQ